MLCDVFDVHRSSYKYWLNRDNSLSAANVELRAEVKKYHALSGGSAGARSIADMLTNEGYPLSRYRAGKLMTELNLVSCQIPKHNYKKANREHVAIPNILERQFHVIEPNTYWCGDVTMDAMGCQFAIADKIVEEQADYVLALKGNQGEFHDDIKLFLESHLVSQFNNISHSVSKAVNGEHGRIEQRNVWLTSDVQWLIERHPRWKSIKGIAVVDSIREVQGRVSHEQRFYITSHGDKNADFIASAIRSHWFVENKLHWQLDVSFNEDQNRLRSGYAAENFSMMNKIALNLLKNEKSVKVGVKTKRLKAGWDEAYMMKVLTVGFTSV